MDREGGTELSRYHVARHLMAMSSTSHGDINDLTKHATFDGNRDAHNQHVKGESYRANNEISSLHYSRHVFPHHTFIFENASVYHHKGGQKSSAFITNHF